MLQLSIHRLVVRCPSLTAGALLAVSLAGATSANAAIVYGGPINAVVTQEQSSWYTLAINFEGANYAWDFVIVGGGQPNTGFAAVGNSTSVIGSQGIAEKGPLHRLYAKNFAPPSPIGSTAGFYTNTLDRLILKKYPGAEDPSAEFQSGGGYVGIRFGVGANIRYGWVQVQMGSLDSSSFTVVDYAYESTAGQAISAGTIPAPGAVALLGAAGLVGSRRRR
ncbi:MAG: hypothetical protein FJ260_09915 [Planctomycetes bacterium]|nr:hypothetical protein [Planctomycetota bacterium]